MSLNDISTDSDETSLDLRGLRSTLDESAVDLNASPVNTVGRPINSNNAGTRLNRLNALPAQLFSMVCDAMNWSSRTERTGLLSLRRTCRNSNEKSDFTVSRLFPLRITRFSLEANSLALFLSLSSKPRFAKHMHIIHIVSDGPSTQPEEYEDEYSFVRTGEAALILTQCLRNLQDTSSLRWLTYEAGTSNFMGLTTILRALQTSQFPRKVADVIFHDHERDTSWGSLSGLTEFRPYIRRAQIHSPMLLPGRWLAPRQPEERRYRLGLDPLQVAVVTRDVNVLQISAVSAGQSIAFLHQRDENEFLYSWFIKELYYPHLVELHLGSLLYVSGSQLCKFFEKHAATLSTFHASITTLTDGSWTDVFTGLRKLPYIQHVGFRMLYQKEVVKGDIARPHPYPKVPPQYGLEICSDQAKSLLDDMITYFEVYNGSWSLAYQTQYWEVILFEVTRPCLHTVSRRFPNIFGQHAPFGTGPFLCSKTRWLSS
ncbi:hypothetical protein PTT_06779 [Pyrenophora teres f. teres 0-1]|uniref:Uncharacterized protein n=1 Tax=Pyrenophora teres f. teres (strain 0-1) TaxID=861557 RepID=E3RG79_PYRTT|nr:hypothetical protein PTT_06779 [Pyrenophora teres f. teres 0-1]